MIELLLLQADAISGVGDVVAGGAGWVGAGLLGFVVYWLLSNHIPTILKDHKEERETHAALIAKIHSDCTEERKEQFKSFSIALEKVLDQHSRDHEETDEALRALRQSLETTTFSGKTDHGQSPESVGEHPHKGTTRRVQGPGV